MAYELYYGACGVMIVLGIVFVYLWYLGERKKEADGRAIEAERKAKTDRHREEWGDGICDSLIEK